MVNSFISIKLTKISWPLQILQEMDIWCTKFLLINYNLKLTNIQFSVILLGFCGSHYMTQLVGPIISPNSRDFITFTRGIHSSCVGPKQQCWWVFVGPISLFNLEFPLPSHRPKFCGLRGSNLWVPLASHIPIFLM